jgi:3-hydroxymyristoyl/3-hydroxydecanoyl-(acyl carrier protein) dehydratase
MTTQPEVLGVSAVAGGVELALRIPEALDYLPDHFPRFAMVPGVVQLDWAVRYAREHLAVAGEFRGLAGLKFQHPLLPRAQVTLRLSREGEALAFAYRMGEQPCSGGRILLGSADA